MIDYTEELFNAIKTISKKEIEALKFDTTIEATITDASRAKYGVYTVTNGSVYFTAYSTDTEYRDKDTVLIMIPRGDYNQQKIIVGKKASTDTDKPINYTAPFSQIIDITNNLVSNLSEVSMIANGDNYKWENNDTSLFANINDILTKTNLVWSARPYELGQEDTFKEEKGLTRVGLKADFRTSLKQFNTISGNYGLVLCVGFRNPDEQLSTSNSLHSTIIQPFIFDSKDFFGNIYNFNTYYSQEAVFDISQYSDLILSDLFLFAYQKNNFKDIYNVLIPHGGDPNIFINNCYICLGQELDTFDKDSLTLTSLSSNIYSDEDKNKTISLRWIHKDENTNKIKSLTQRDFDDIYSQEYEIRWYVNSFNNSPDSFTEAHWDRYTGTTDQDIATNKLSIEYNFEDALEKKESQKKFQVAVIKKDLDGNGSYLIARSNILEFNNQNDVNKGLTIKDINALGIQFKDSEQGYYLIYNSFYELENNEDTAIRELTAVFADETDNVYNKSPIDSYEKITWIIPFENSMIIPLDYMRRKITGAYRATEDGYNYNIEVDNENKYYIITHEKNNSNANDNVYNDQFYTTIPYQINKTLDFNNQNNTIYLELEKTTGATYTAQATMYFNKAGTSGSDYTMIIKWDRQNVVFDISKADEQLTGQMILLNPKGQICDLNNSEAEYTYNWYKYDGNVDSSSLEVIPIEDDDLHENLNNFKFKIQKRDNSSISINELYILEVKLTNFQNYELITRVPIPLTQSAIDGQELFNVDQIAGPTQIRYSTDGSLFFNKTPYNISFQMKENEQWGAPVEDTSDVGYWRIIPEDTSIAYLNNSSTATTTNIIQFFMNEQEEIKKRLLLYRLIVNTVDNIEDNNLQLKDFNSFNIDNLMTILNQDQTGEEYVLFTSRYDDFLNLVKKYTNLFINNQKISSLLDLLQQIAFNSSNQSLLTNCLKEYNWENFKKNTQLLPATFYINDNNIKLYGVQYIYNQNIVVNGQNYANFTLWTQPIYIYQDIYPSPTLNKWNGELVIDNDKNAILAKSMSAGRKETDNTFSGVMFGDWTEDNGDTKFTGIYGFNHGKMTYAFKDNGSAFLGNDNGKISFNNNNSINLLVEENNNRVEIKPGALIVQTRETITDPYNSLLEINKVNGKNIYLLQSQNFSDINQTGMYFDLLQGQIKGYNFSLSSQSTINDINYGIFLSSGQQNSPLLQISRENTEKNLNLIESTSFYSNIIEEKIEELQNFIQEYYADYLELISLFSWFYNYDKSFFKDEVISPEESDKEFYDDLLNYFDSSTDTVDNLYNKILNHANNNNYNNLYNAETNSLIDDWYFEWNFDEIPNAFLEILTEEQISKLKDNLEIFTSTNNMNISLNKNLFYPKIPQSILNNKNYPQLIYNKICGDYDNLIYKIQKQGYLLDNSGYSFTDKINLINQVNEEAKKIIKEFQLDSIDYQYHKAEIRNEEDETITTMYYIDIFPGVLGHVSGTMKNGASSGVGDYNGTGFYLRFNDKVFSDDFPYDKYRDCSTKGKFSSQTIGIEGKNKTFLKLSVSVDDNSPFVLLKKTNTSTYAAQQASLLQTYFEKSIPYPQTAVDIYLLPAYSGSDFWTTDQKEAFNDLINWDYSSVTSFYLYYTESGGKTPYNYNAMIKIKESDSLIGKQKILCIIQEKLNKYKKLLSKTYELFYAETAQSIVKLLNKYYQQLQTVLNNLANQYSGTDIIKSEMDARYIQVPLNFDFREKFQISLEEMKYFYYENNQNLNLCSKENFISLQDDNFKFKDDTNYYIKLYTPNSVQAFFQLYVDIPNSSDYFHQESNSGRWYYSPLSNYKIINLAMNILKEREKIENEEKTSGNIDFNTSYIFDEKKWTNDLININKNGGYLTSKNYRPTILSTDTVLRKPTDYQNPGTTVGWSYGMKGMVIDLTNDRIILGNNSQIYGFQTQYNPGQTDISHRSFVISTGAKFNGKVVEGDDETREQITEYNGNYFLIGRSGWTASSNAAENPIIFGIKWDGSIVGQHYYIEGKKVEIQGYTSNGIPTNSDSEAVGYWLTVK